MSDVLQRIPLDRRVCVVRADRIDVRPERGAVVGPLIGLAMSIGLFVSIVVFASDLPAWVLGLMLIPGLVLAPFSAMGLLYSLIGAAVVVERKKQSIRFHQGVLGLGLGTVELVPFWKAQHIEVADCPLGDVEAGGIRPPLDLRAWEVIVQKVSGKRLPIGQVFSANTPDLIDEGFGRALDAAQAIADMAGKEVVITAEIEAEEPTTESQTEVEVGEERARDARGRAEPAAG